MNGVMGAIELKKEKGGGWGEFLVSKPTSIRMELGGAI